MSGKNCKPTLGKVEKTNRGFKIVRFTELYGAECSLQESSLAVYQKPGTSAIWLGCQQNARHPGTGEELSPRMHLDRKQVVALVNHLKAWLIKDTFKP